MQLHWLVLFNIIIYQTLGVHLLRCAAAVDVLGCADAGSINCQLFANMCLAIDCAQ